MSTPSPRARPRTLVVELPEWIDHEVANFAVPLTNDDARMALTLHLARENVARGGGPFASLVFVADELIACGVNLVLSSGLSIAHAEIVAMMQAQSAMGAASLALPPLTLYASTEPCCQCFG